MITYDYITYTYRFLYPHLNRTIRLIPSYCSKFIPHELAGEPNGPIDHGLQPSKIK